MEPHPIIRQLQDDAEGCRSIAEGYEQSDPQWASIARELAADKLRAADIAPFTGGTEVSLSKD